MSARDDILSALGALADSKSGLTARELAPRCPSCEFDEQIVANTIAQLRKEELIRPDGFRNGGMNVYVVNRATALPEAESHREEPDMKGKQSLKERIVAALEKRSPRSLHELAKDCDSTAASIGTYMKSLVQTGRVRRNAVSRGSYEIAKSNVGQVPPKAPPRAHPPTPPLASPATPKPPGISGAARFAIDAEGALGILKGEVRVDLEPGEFAELRTFIGRAEAIWNQQ